MQTIKFEEMPEDIQRIFRSVKSKCLCRVRQMRDGAERYYVTVHGETSVFSFTNHRWTHLRSY